MINYFRKPLDFLLFSNIFISLGAVSQGLVTYHLLGFTPSWYILSFLFFSTIVAYNFSILIQKPRDPLNSKYRRVRWIFKNYKLNLAITFVSCFALIPVTLLLSLPSKILVVILGIISFGYSIPIFSSSSSGRKFGFRNIPGLKLVLIAMVWAFSSVTLPLLELSQTHHLQLSIQDEAILTIKRFLFVTAITIPFDIRDMFQDQTFKLKTIPTVFGEKKSYLLCQLLLIVYLLLLFFYKSFGFNAAYFALTITVLLTGWLIFKSKWEKNEYYYFFYLDGTLILQYIMLLLFSLKI